MYTAEELLAKVNAAIKAITVADLGSAVLQPEKQQKFVRAMEAKAVALAECRRLDMKSHTADIDRIGFGSRILQVPPAAGVAPEDRKPTIGTNQIVAKEFMAVVGVKDSTMEDNIEKADFADSLNELIGNRCGVDLQEVCFQGDTGSGDTFLAQFDGWLKLAGNAVSGAVTDKVGGGNSTVAVATAKGDRQMTVADAANFAADDFVRIGAGLTREYAKIQGVAGAVLTFTSELKHAHYVGEAVVEITELPDFNLYDVEDMFDAMLSALPEQYKADPSQLRFWVPWATENAYRDKLRARGTALGDQAQQASAPLAFKGVPIRACASVPAGKALLAHPDNMAYGVYRDVRIEPEREAKLLQTDFVASLRAGANYEEEDGAVVASGYEVPPRV
ncbi:MAG: phage major capsid protein [Firmicutes bacterium]|nr:phage major capsid protein [Bacillota bacterium]